MVNGIRIKVTLKNGDIKYHTLPFGLRDSEVYGWVCDEYGGDATYEYLDNRV